MENIEIKGNLPRPGDVVYVPVRADNRTKPGKVVIEEVAVIMRRTGGFQVQCYSQQGHPLPDDTYPDPWTCEKAITILDNHKRLAEQELEALRAEIEKAKGEKK